MLLLLAALLANTTECRTPSCGSSVDWWIPSTNTTIVMPRYECDEGWQILWIGNEALCAHELRPARKIAP